MNCVILKRGIVLTIILLFLGAGTIPNTYANDKFPIDNPSFEDIDSEEKTFSDSKYILIFDQQPAPSELLNNAPSSIARNNESKYKIFDTFWQTDGKIDKVVWWGICSHFIFDIDPNTFDFQIEFYDDPINPVNAPPQNCINSYYFTSDNFDITYTGKYMNEQYQLGEIIKFEYELPNTTEIPEGEGWISIQAYDKKDYSFFLIQSISGDNFSYQDKTMDPMKDFDVAFQLYQSEKNPPTVAIDKPTNGIYVKNDKKLSFLSPIIIGDITIEISAEDIESGIDYVEIYIDGVMEKTLNSEPYSWLCDDLSFWKHTITAKAYDQAGNSATSNELIVFKLF